MEIKDLVGRDKIVSKICYLIDELPRGEQFCLALNGEWGSGKSFILNMLENKLSEHKEYFIVRYDAWKNSFYEDPLIAILYCLVDSLKEEIDNVEGSGKKLKRVGKKILKDIQTALDKKEAHGYSPELLVPFAGYKLIKQVIQLVNVAKFDLHNHQKFDDFKSYQTLIKEIQGAFNEFTQFPMYDKKQSKLIILVDEIDRCLPNEQLIILERLHHLFEIKNCAVIVAINKDAIATAFHTQQGADGSEYLKKFFKHNFAIATKWQMMLKNKLSCAVEECLIAKGMDTIMDDDDFESLKKFIVGVYEEGEYLSIHKKVIDNRSIDRYIQNVKQVMQKLHVEKINYYHIWVICVVMFCRMYYMREFHSFMLGKEQGQFKDLVALKKYGMIEEHRTQLQKIVRYNKTSSQRVIKYNNNRFNYINYLYNYIKKRNLEEVPLLHDAYLNMDIKPEWDDETIEMILKEIDNYSEDKNER